MFIASLIVVALAIWYLPYRAKTVFKLKKAWPGSVLLFLLLTGYLATIMSGFYLEPNVVAQWAYNILGLAFMVIIYLLALVLGGHLLAKIFKPLNSQLAMRAEFLLALGLILYGWANVQTFTVTRHEIPLPGLAQPVTVAHIPDLHLGAQRQEKYLNKVIKAINELKPDIVIYNGDLIDSNIALRPELFRLFKKVKSEQYFTTGNHEYYINTNKALELIAGAGIIILKSQSAQTHGLELIGLDYMNGDRGSTDAHRVNDLYMDEELPKIPRGQGPAILIHHSPVGLKEPLKNGIKVMLSGHTHGGQIFPFTALISRYFPYFKGRYELNGLTLLVSQGAGTFGPWMRLGTFNEIQLITFRP
ncbi:MAG: metallophosphoesterase [Deltaproteobacteria bacterium]|jgi:predicted MPP superfamily phosphohydrolase|nr:metallophosphoesterase [Deltaproteobacteria bacterium]